MTDRPSQLEAARVAFRQRLLDTEAGATETVARQYVETRRRILQHLAAVEKEIAIAGEPETAAERIEAASRLFRSQRYQNLLRQIDAEIARLGETVRPVIVETQGVVVRNGVEEVRQLALTSAAETSRALALRVAGQWSMLPVSALNELIASFSAPGSPMADWLADLGPSTARAITDTIRDGLALGFHPRKIEELLTKRADMVGVRVMTLTRTSVLDAYRVAALQQMSESADVLDGWRWSADHSSRTCAACLALDGEVFPVTKTFMGAHVNCRCAPIPVVTGTAPSTRETGADWFEKQPDTVKQKMLPVSAWEPYKRGDVQLGDFVELNRDEKWGDRYGQKPLREIIGS